MPFFSFGEDAVGFIAIGTNATGVLAIGVFAQGAIAIGVLAFGGIAISVGASVGVLAIGGITTSIGIAAFGGNPIGAFAYGVGVGLGLVRARVTGVAIAWRAEAVGAAISIRPDDPPADPDQPSTVPLSTLLDGGDGWARVEVVAVDRERNTVTVAHGRARVELPHREELVVPLATALGHVQPEARPHDARAYREASSERAPTIVAVTVPPRRPFWDTRAGFWTKVAIRGGLYYGVLWGGVATFIWIHLSELLRGS